MSIDPQFWNDEPVLFHLPAPHADRDKSEGPISDDDLIASLADPDFARQWLTHNEEINELLYQQRRSAEKKLAKVHVLAALWAHEPDPSHGLELLKILTKK